MDGSATMKQAPPSGRLMASTVPSCASTTDFTAVCDGAEAEVGAYIQLYDAAAQSFSESTNLPPQGSGYIELICCVPTGWQKLNVTFVPTFVANKSLTFTLSSSDIAQA